VLNLALNLALTFTALILVTLFVPYVQMPHILTLIPTTLLIGFMNFLIRPMMVMLGIDLTSGKVFGFTLILNWLFFNVGLGLLDEFDEQGWVGAFFGALFMAILQIIFLRIDYKRRKPIT
jgi:putative membrane protein